MVLIVTGYLDRDALRQLHSGNNILTGLHHITQGGTACNYAGNGIDTLTVLTLYGRRSEHLLKMTYIAYANGIGSATVKQDILNILQLGAVLRSITYLYVILLTVLTEI